MEKGEEDDVIVAEDELIRASMAYNNWFRIRIRYDDDDDDGESRRWKKYRGSYVDWMD